MKKIVLLFSLLLMVGSSFGQKDWDEYVRRFRPAIISNPLETADVPDRFSGSWMVIDTSNSNKLSIFNGEDMAWESKITLDSLTIDGFTYSGASSINTLTDGYWDDTYDNLGLGMTTFGDSIASPGDMSETILIGKTAGFNAEAIWYGIYIGDGAGYSDPDGYYNTYIGYNSAYSSTGSTGNVVTGHQAFYNPLSGSYNVVLGNEALLGNGGGAGDNDWNVIIGNAAAAGLHGSSDGNTLIGNDVAGTLDTGSYNVIIGEDVEPPQPDTSYYFGLGANGNTVISGDIDDNWLHFPGGQRIVIKDIAAATGNIVVGDYFVTVSYTDTGTADVTLASALALETGMVIIVFDKELNASANNITISTEGSETINEAATATISTDGGKLTIVADGTNFIAY